MRAFALLGIAAGIVCGSGSLTTPTNAGGAYLSRTGGSSLCTLATPCSDMGTAIGVAGVGGEVICLDKGPYGAALITFSITISCGDGLWDTPGGTVGINPPAGADVIIEGLVLNGTGTAGTRMGVTGQGSLHLRRVRIGNAPGSGSHGLDFQPTGPAKLHVTDSDFYRMGNSGISAGINIRPASGVTAQVSIQRSRFESNRFGIIADGNGGGIIRGVVSDSIIAGNANNGITVSTTSANVVLTVDSSKISGNNFGLVATGNNAGMLVRNSSVVSNATGLSTGSGGVLFSYGNNSVNANTTTDGAFSGLVSQK